MMNDDAVILIGLYGSNIKYLLTLLASRASHDDEAADIYNIIHELYYA